MYPRGSNKKEPKKKGRGSGRPSGGPIIREPGSNNPAANVEFSRPLWTLPTFQTEDFFGTHGSETLPPESQEVEPARGSDDPRSSGASAQPSEDDDSWDLDENGRRLIQPLGDSFHRATEVCREMYKIVDNHWGEAYTNITGALDTDKDLWWGEFERKYYWAPRDEAEVKRIFKKKVGDHMRNVMNKAKAKGKRPAFLNQRAWEEIQRKWASHAYKETSDRNKLNRTSGSGVSGTATYAGGSISMGEHRRKMAKEHGSQPSYPDLFQRVFKKKDNTYVSDRAKEIKETFDEFVRQNSVPGGEGDSEMRTLSQADLTKYMFDASSVVKKKGKVFGGGCLVRDLARSIGASTSSTGRSRGEQRDPQNAEEMERLRLQIVQRDELIEQLRQGQDQTNQALQEMREQMNVLMSQQRRRARNAPAADDENENEDQSDSSD